MAAFVPALKKFGLLFLLLTVSLFSMAQRTVSGKVFSGDSDQPLPGATITVKNTGKITTTDGEGIFSVEAGDNDLLQISNVGYTTVEIKASSATVVTLQSQSRNLSEVVITALGIKKEKKRLGYAIQEVKGEELTVARESNVVNQLAGKIAGVTVIGSPSGIGGSARVSIRGERSVDLNKNQPLYVVDGVPVSNSITGASGKGNLEVDFGNGASFINPDDIESMSVLKGPAASALYGSRAANGVILIKTISNGVWTG
jgi:TonB-dependent SusC/RagA subfamily outer membrane receptor